MGLMGLCLIRKLNVPSAGNRSSIAYGEGQFYTQRFSRAHLHCLSACQRILDPVHGVAPTQ